MENDIIFSKMQIEDLDKIIKIENDCFSTPWTKEGFEEAIGRSYCCFITAKTKNGEIAGYCGMYQSDTEADITNVAVDKNFRRMGIAKKMVAELMRLGNLAGVKDFTLEVRVGNEPAINLYNKLGFQTVGIRKNFYRNPVEDANIMWFYG